MEFYRVHTKVLAGCFVQFSGPRDITAVAPGLYMVKWPNGTEEIHRIQREENEDSREYWQLYFHVNVHGENIRVWMNDGHDIMLSERMVDLEKVCAKFRAGDLDYLATVDALKAIGYESAVAEDMADEWEVGNPEYL